MVDWVILAWLAVAATGAILFLRVTADEVGKVEAFLKYAEARERKFAQRRREEQATRTVTAAMQVRAA